MAVERRLDIDLLRAIAVLQVILYHFHAPGVTGGFIGVDVFFVISGYLISGQIANRISVGNFSYIEFFARRARRLVPALSVTLLLTWIAALWLMTPDLLRHTLKEIAYSSAYLSNFFFWLESGYFDSAAITKPLLHTWSLSVEEQFYLFWPVLMVIAFRFRARHLLTALGFLSLLACEWMMTVDPSAAFFLFPFRIFEFAIGAVLWQLPTPRSGWISNAISVLSLLVLAASAVVLDERSHFPGVTVLPACLATAWIIAARSQFLNRTNWLTSVGSWLGKVSYSAYLVHWPLVVFYTQLFGSEIGVAEFFVLLGLTFLLSELMWRFVEQPFQRSTVPVRRYVLGVPLSVVGALLLMLAGPSLYAKIHAERRSLDEIVEALPKRIDVVRLLRAWAVRENNVGPRLSVVGDSHAVDMSLALKLAADRPLSINLMRTLCDPVVAELSASQLEALYSNHANATAEECESTHQSLVEQIKAQQPDVVIYAERWREEALPYLAQTIRDIKQATGAPVVLFGRTQEFGVHPALILRELDSVDQINSAAWARRQDHTHLSKQVANIALETDSHFIDRAQPVCPRQGSCVYYLDDGLTYIDASHWTELGMRHFGAQFIRRLAELGLLEQT